MRIIPAAKLGEKGITLSRSQLRRLENARKFPKRVRISERLFGYIETELDEFLEDRAAARDVVKAAE